MSIEKLRSVGVLNVRVQVPKLHEGHVFTFKHVMDRHDDVFVIVGVVLRPPSEDNPLSFEMREGMIRATFPNRKLVIVPSYASRKDYFQRSLEMDALIEKTFPGRDAIIYGARDSIVHKYSGKFPTYEVTTIYHGSGTEIRRASKVINSHDFRAGVIHTVVDRPPIGRPAVDVALLRRTCRQVLLVGKPGESELRFPGIYFDPDQDEDYEHAAERVLTKELPSMTSRGLIIKGSKMINDWRYRGSRDKVISVFFVGEANSGTPTPGEGVDRAQWFDMDNLHRTLIPEHRPLAEFLK